MKFNGPTRSSDQSALGCDLKIIQMIQKTENNGINNSLNNSNNKDSHNSNNDNSSSSNNNNNNNDDNKENSDAKNSKNVELENPRSTLSSKCLVEQLPNTVSVSFRGKLLLFYF